MTTHSLTAPGPAAAAASGPTRRSPPAKSTSTSTSTSTSSYSTKPASAAAPTPLPTDTQIFLRSFLPRESLHPLFFLSVVLLATTPALFDLGSPESPLPLPVRDVLAAVGPAHYVFGQLLVLSHWMRSMWAAAVMRVGLGGFMTYGLFVWTTALYYTHAGILGLLDLSLRYPSSALGRWAKAHKIQDAKLVTAADWLKCLKVVIRNQLLINIPLGLLYFRFVYAWSVGRVLGADAANQDVLAVDGKGTWWAARMPSAGQVGKEFLVCALVEEVLFYSTHRLFHWGPLYKRFHKIHHEFTAPIGLAATYAHPLEHTLSNLTPVLLGPALFGMHPLSALVWITLAITTTVHTHSGYELYGWPTARKHDWHHYAFIYQFGVSGVVDKWLGTDGGERYRRYVWRYDERVRMVREGSGTVEEADRADEEDEKLK